ncbi:MAG: hypothetical protein PF638_11520 [Candidatus Delongbacteria bacterium]|jgi:hypothetical protein|nr:hypothetical protein [Candidatus Delongbacteria bacterium]
MEELNLIKFMLHCNHIQTFQIFQILVLSIEQPGPFRFLQIIGKDDIGIFKEIKKSSQNLRA